MTDDLTDPTNDSPEDSGADSGAPAPRRRRRAAGRDSGPPPEAPPAPEPDPADLPAAAAQAEPADEPVADPDVAELDDEDDLGPDDDDPSPEDVDLDSDDAQAEPEPAPAARRRRRATRDTASPTAVAFSPPESDEEDADGPAPTAFSGGSIALTFQGIDEAPAPRQRRRPATPPPAAEGDENEPEDAEGVDDADGEPGEDGEGADGTARRRRRRGRRGRGRGRPEGEDGEGGEGGPEGVDGAAEPAADGAGEPAADATDEGDDEGEDDGRPGSSSSRRRRRRRRGGGGGGGDDAAPDDPPNTVTHVRDGVRGVSGSTRLEAKRQRRREGRSESRRRVIVTEAEFLARRESVVRTMVVRRTANRTHVAMLEDGVLVEHYVTRAESTSYAGNIYLGRVQNVLPSMEAAFVDIGKGRNAVLYAGEVSYDASQTNGSKAPRIEQALKAGQSVLVQVTKDPVGHKGARLTSQVSLPGRFLVYVPEGPMTGISRKLPETERARLKAILKKIVPEDAGVIIRTAAEGASEEDITRDVERLQALWQKIVAKSQKASPPNLLHGEPDLVVRVVRDVFNEDISELIVQGEGTGDATDWSVAEEIEGYVGDVAPDLLSRVHRYAPEVGQPIDAFAAYRIDEQLRKALERKVNLPSGGSLVIDRTEALTAIDVNTGRFTGSGGNLEETVTRNNLEAAEEIARQLRLRDIGGMVIVDFIDMVLESNRELVLRRLVECLSRDRTKHQVSEVTSLGLVQLTRKRVGQGLLEAFSEPCPHCGGRGVLVHTEDLDKPKPKVPSPMAVARKVKESHNTDAPAEAPAAEEVPAAEASPAEPVVTEVVAEQIESAEPVEVASGAAEETVQAAEVEVATEAAADEAPKAPAKAAKRRRKPAAAASSSN